MNQRKPCSDAMNITRMATGRRLHLPGPLLIGHWVRTEKIQLALADDTQINVTSRPQVIEDPGCYGFTHQLLSFLLLRKKIATIVFPDEWRACSDVQSAVTTSKRKGEEKRPACEVGIIFSAHFINEGKVSKVPQWSAQGSSAGKQENQAFQTLYAHTPSSTNFHVRHTT